MRFPVILLAIILATANLSGQKTVNTFIDRIKNERKSVAMSLPGWLIRAGINLSTRGIEDRDEKEIRELGKKIKKLRFVVVEDDHGVSDEESNQFVHAAKNKDGFSEYARIRDGSTRTMVLVKEKGDKIQYLTIFSRSPEHISVINLKTDITMSDLDEADFSFKKKNLNSETN